jgi:cytoskeleton protein RodZ
VESVDENADRAASRTLGQAFAAERERQGLSRADAAQRLHMSAWQIEALETGDYQRLPKGTFLRGFVRNYAKVLGLAPDDMLELLPEEAPRDRKPGIVVPTQNIRFDPLGDRLQNPYVKAGALAFVALALGFAVLYWVFFVRPAQVGAAAHKDVETQLAAPPVLATQSETIAKVAAAPQPVTTEAASGAEPPKAEPPKAEARKVEPPKAEARKVDPPKVEIARAEPPPRPDAGRAASPKAAIDGGVLKFRFKGSSWVEIRDSRGRVLLSKLNLAGSEAEVAGRPPFNVVVGNAPEVQLFYNDHEFDLEPHTKVAVARFTVE